ncbi:hypothetical protein Bbelb_370400 [Branchiostoma belcheri]|nr:hypothetical protein Bbelb_370400 [Branchiostoma belcheri]
MADQLVDIAPHGAGLATVVITFIFSTYYNVIITWALYYLFNSFQGLFPARLTSVPPDPLPWATCGNPWNTENCTTGLNRSLLHNGSTSPSNDHNVLEISSGIDDFGAPQWDLSLTLLLAWVIVYLCIFKGVKSTGKVVYFTATFPYIVLIALLIRGLTLDGAVDGILYFLKPKWYLLGTAEVSGEELQSEALRKMSDRHQNVSKVWINAAAQNLGSIGIAYGGCIALSSYNKFKNNVFKDTLMIACINSATSILAGFAIFSVMGYMAFLQGTTVEEVATQGPGLAFVVYPQAITTMPVSPLWAILFFIMLLLLGIDSQGIMIFGFIQYTPVRYGDYYYPGWGQAIGWVIASLSIISIPIGAIHALLKEKGGFVQRFKATLKSKIPDRGALRFEPEEIGSYQKKGPSVPPSYNEISRHEAAPLSPMQESAL